MGRMSDAVESLRNEVSETASAIDSAILLIAGLVNRLGEALMGDSLAEDIEELRNELDGAQNKLATAVAENTAAAEDSDTVYDPTPVGEDHEETEPVLEPEPQPNPSTDGSSESSDETVSEPVVEDGAEVVGGEGEGHNSGAGESDSGEEEEPITPAA